MGPKCVIDRTVLNESTIPGMDDIGLSFFAKLCGNNRGVFVVDPPDGNTYGCGSFPSAFSTDVGLSDTISDSVHVVMTYAAGNMTSAQTVDVLDSYVKAVYDSSTGNDNTPFACDLGGLATLVDCEHPTTATAAGLLDGGVRAVTLAGAFVPVPWVTGGKVLTMDEVVEFYSKKDFRDMAEMGVNTVVMPVPCRAFYSKGEVADTVSRLLERAEGAGLKAIIVLVDEGKGGDDASMMEKHVGAAASFAASSASVIALQLPPSPIPSLAGVARSTAPGLKLLVPTNKERINRIDRRSLPEDGNVFAALELGYHASIANVASSDSLSDRMKMFYHESLVCMDRSPIEWLDCYRGMPVFASGFDLSIDDCHLEGTAGFADYGQCDRFNETINSGWWERHRESLASRQLFAYSLGLGWSFTAWKLYGDRGGTIIDSPSKLLCLRDVAEAGLMPSLKTGKYGGVACLNGPKTDFALGDSTLSPTPGPPPDCGYGWWNPETLQCDYWVPPPPTVAPTVAPTPADYSALGIGAAGGATLALFLSWAARKMTGRTEGYSPLP